MTLSSALEEVLIRLMRDPRDSKAVVGSSLLTVYKLLSLSGRVMLPGRKPFVLYTQPLPSKKNDTRDHLVLEER